MDAVSPDVAFAVGALLMAADFIVKLGPLYLASPSGSVPASTPQHSLKDFEIIL
jgi:hypothetical protein